MHVEGFDPWLTVERAWQLSPSVVGAVSVDDLVAGADVISLHIPLDDKTRLIIDKRYLELMKQGAILINFSRAGVVDETALCAALHSGKLRAYVTDSRPAPSSISPALLRCLILALRPMRRKSIVRAWSPSRSRTFSKTARFVIR